ncbi:hypothetical protein DXN05_03975 [Deminuibacter soli]|uniref:Uncharacterized protein n=1 Tax=Deminuibacter soli TaxID=2291815 RepID=A0A3E1NQE7_9BACT|nr:hypothetical protein DXN05_03975 [Deminuibacter soli]
MFKCRPLFIVQAFKQPQPAAFCSFLFLFAGRLQFCGSVATFAHPLQQSAYPACKTKTPNTVNGIIVNLF